MLHKGTCAKEKKERKDKKDKKDKKDRNQTPNLVNSLIASNRLLSLAPPSEWTMFHDNPLIIESLQWCEKKKTTNHEIECPNLFMLS